MGFHVYVSGAMMPTLTTCLSCPSAGIHALPHLRRHGTPRLDARVMFVDWLRSIVETFAKSKAWAADFKARQLVKDGVFLPWRVKRPYLTGYAWLPERWCLPSRLFNFSMSSYVRHVCKLIRSLCLLCFGSALQCCSNPCP
jgi:hypothetical protein